ncbi:hypothetical protein YC2023_022738 [Brassica napus]
MAMECDRFAGDYGFGSWLQVEMVWFGRHIGGSDKSRLRRYGVFDSTSGWYRAANEDIINIFRSLLIAILKDCCIGFSYACV